MTKQEADAARAYFTALGKELLKDLPDSSEVHFPNRRRK